MIANAVFAVTSVLMLRLKSCWFSFLLCLFFSHELRREAKVRLKLFLVADSVHQFVQLSVVLLVCCLIHWAMMTESKNVKISIFALPEYMGVEGGVKGGCTPAHPYCNPAVLI